MNTSRVVLDLGKSGCRGRIEGTALTWEWPGLPVGGAGSDDAIDILSDGILDGLTRAPRAPHASSGSADIATVLIGSNFIPRIDFVEPVTRRLCHARPGVGFLLLEDGLLAHAGALGRPGVVASVGTGTVVFGIDDAATVTRVDGWGPDLGDRGSAVDLGKRGLAAILEARDGVAPATALTEAAERYLARPLVIETVRWLLGAPDRVPLLAGFARHVVDTAAAGDPQAQRLVHDAAHRIADSCLAAANGATHLPVAIVGRLGTMDHYAHALQTALHVRGLTQQPALGTALDTTWGTASAAPYVSLARIRIDPAAH